MQLLLAPAKIGAVMFTAAFHTSRHYILFTVMACLCVLLGGPSYAAGAESLIIAGATYYEPGVSGSGWAWTDADHLELNGYAGEAIGADGDLVVALTGQNSVQEMQTSDVDISQCGMEVWGNLTLRGTGSLTATGSQCGIHVMREFAVDGCTVNARADGVGVTDELVAGAVSGSMAVRGGGRVVATGVCSGADVRAYGLYLLDGEPGDVASYGKLDVNASWLDATGADGGVACLGASLTSARFVTPAGGAFGAGGAVDTGGAVVAHVVIEPTDAAAPTGETDTPDGEVPSGGAADDVDPAIGGAATEQATNPTVKPAVATKTTTTTAVTKTAVAKAPNPKSPTATSSSLPKTADSHWIALSSMMFVLGTAVFAAARRC